MGYITFFQFLRRCLLWDAEGHTTQQAAMATSRRFFSMPPMVATVERGGYGKGFNVCGVRRHLLAKPWHTNGAGAISNGVLTGLTHRL